MLKTKIFSLIGLIIIVNFLGSLSSLVVKNSINVWYNQQIIKAIFTPPNWIFAPAWIILYTLMAIAIWLVWYSRSRKKIKQTAVYLFIIQLFFNYLWTFLFFGLKNPALAFGEIILLEVMIILTMLQFQKIHRAAAWLLVPYLLWVSFAAVLNLTIWLYNS